MEHVENDHWDDEEEFGGRCDDDDNNGEQKENTRQQCRLTICIELDELTNSEAAAATPPTVIQNL